MRHVGILLRRTLCIVLFIALGQAALADDNVSLKEEIPLKKMAGVYHLPVEVNGVMKLTFILDTGAADMSIPHEVVYSLMRTGTLKEEDFISSKIYILADGTRVKSPRIIIRKVKIGNRVLRNIPATISDSGGPLLLGQSLLEEIGSYTFDSKRQVLVLHSDTGSPRGDILPRPEKTPEHRLVPIVHHLKDTEKVVEQFFLSVTAQNFEISWNMLSTYSQNTIVTMVAKEAEKPPELIRELFESNHKSVQKGFWSSFRDSSRIPVIVSMASYQQMDRSDSLATVRVQVGEEEIRFELYEEDGAWKLGLIESIERFRSLK